jgi:hypothetical protein
MIFSSLIAKFERTGSVLDDLAKKVGPEKSVVTPTNIEKVREFYTSQPSTSLAKASQQLDIKQTSLWKILQKELNMYPYKIQVQQPLNQRDVTRRLEFANKIVEMVESKELDPRKIIFSDEAHFQLNGYVNKQNYRIWGTENPHFAVVRPLHPKKLTVVESHMEKLFVLIF